MGMDAEVTIWVGIRSEDCGEDYDVQDVAKKLPSDLFESDEDDELSELWKSVDLKACKEKYGFVLEFVSCSDETIGLGIMVFEHDWDYGIAAFDPMEVQNKIELMRPKLEKLFAESNIDVPIGVWCQTDYS